MANEHTIGSRIANVRGNESQAAFGTKIGVHKNTIGRIERGEYMPDAAFLQSLYREYGISPTWVLTGQEPKQLFPGAAVGLLMVDAIQKGKPFSIEQQRALGVDDDTFAAYLSGARLATPEFLARFAEMTEYAPERLAAAHAACVALGEMEEVSAKLSRGKDEKKAGRLNEEPASELEAQLLNQYRAADERGKRLIERICEAVAKPSLSAWFHAGQAMAEAATVFESKR